MKIITVGNIKGGVGKSTIACNLSVEASKDKLKCLLVDSDVQQSSIDFRALRSESKELQQFQAISLVKNTLHKDLKEFKDFEVIFIDVGGRDTAVFRSAILACDVMLIPVLPSQYDLWATDDTVEVLKDAQGFKDIEAYFILNQVIPNSNVSKDALEALNKFEIPVLDVVLHSRVAYKQSISDGQGVTEYDKGKAATEVKNLWKEVKKWL